MSTIFSFILAFSAFIDVFAVASVITESLSSRPAISGPWTKSLYDIYSGSTVYPIRVDHRGQAYPRHMQFRQKGQATWYGKTYYNLESLNKTWTLELLPYNQLHRPYTSNSSTLMTRTMEAGCYYKGRIQGNSSLVKVNLCGGMIDTTMMYEWMGFNGTRPPLRHAASSIAIIMTGDIRTSFGDFVIHPLISITNASSLIPHRLSFLEFPDSKRPWRPLLAEDIQFCDVKEIRYYQCIGRFGTFPLGQDAQCAKIRERFHTYHFPTDESFDHHEQERLMNLKESPVYLNASRLQSRKRRSESRERHLEVLVVADSKMAAYHGSNLNHYILTLMSTVALIYKDPSIGNNINIAVVAIKVLSENEDKEVIHHIAPITLRKFCRWQQSRNTLDDRDAAHYDTAILITREDLCRYPGACDTLGLAQSGMVCDSYSSCAIVEDNGLSAAFTIAHELGHVMSIPHDDDNKCTRYHNEKKKLHVMARMLDYNSNPWSWSDCSREYLTTFFDVGFGNCLMDKPIRNLLLDDEFQQSPGQLYPRDRQCELVFGPHSRICPYMPECKRLWCTMDDTTQGGCRTQHMPWADGTQCGDSKRCYQGECIRYRPAIITPVDGQWGKWKPYGKCSRSCGGGVQQAFRECDSPKPANGGRYCTGTRVRYRSCSTQNCPSGSIDFRAEQCAEFNGRDLNIPGVPVSNEWVPQYNTLTPHEKCKLYCKVKGSASYFVLREKVIDGTPCELGGYDVCVNGNCEHAGCDHILYSKKTLDRCGVCGGKNDTCKEIVGHFNKKVDYGYHNIVLIPIGASNIMIQQTSFDGHIDDNYIALKDPDETYLLNGEFMITMFPKKIEYHGISMDYSGSNSVTEYVNSSQILPKDLFLQVLVVGKLQPPNISFSYTVPLSQSKLYTWKLATHFSECSRLCNGISVLKPICVRLSDQHTVNDNHCAQLNKPNSSKVKKCNEHCQLKWKDVSKSECSVQCGKGTRQRIIKCMKEDITMQISHVVPEEHCVHLGPKPSLEEKCYGRCRNSTWIFSEWTECSVSCGKGVQRRSAECKNNKRQKEPDAHCNSSAKVLVRPCEERPCPNWGVGEWTECSVTCGIGFRQRLFYCKQNDKYIDERYCIDEKPVVKEVCRPGDCYEWFHSEWEPCSATCGDGFTEREIFCRSSSELIVDEKFCEHVPKPSLVTNCSSGISCPYLGTRISRHGNMKYIPPSTILSDTNSIPDFDDATWKQSEWTKCSVTCGNGFRHRTVTCHNSEDGSRLRLNNCDPRTKPLTAERCSEIPCPQWRAGEWSECSVTCGKGMRYRTVHCAYSDQQMQTEDSCNLEQKPEVEEVCVNDECLQEKQYTWLTGPWSECSTSCDEGMQQRIVHCLDSEGHQSNPENCFEPSPPRTQSCLLSSCSTWQWSEWSSCPQTCKSPEQMRYPQCLSGERVVSEDNCLDAKPAPEKRHCKLPAKCTYRWRKGTWSQCYSSCGPTYKVREVVCIDHERNRVADSFCSYKNPPKNRKRCDLKPCPYAWKTSHWSECSKSCGDGFKRRAVTCHAFNAYGWMYPEPADTSLCDSSLRPRDTERCNYGDCSSGYVWRPEPWQTCEGVCQFGRQRRRLRCYTFKGNRVPNSKCNKSHKPQRKKKCISSHGCPPKSCKEIQRLQNKRTDGDYQIQIRGKMVTVFCDEMNSNSPKEYINLPENNFAIIYSSELSSQFGASENCINKNAVNTCDCKRSDTGYTIFLKIALNTTNLKIKIDDFKFTNSYFGKNVPYATAGDCQRNPHCLHGLFSVSLNGTDFRVASGTNWVSRAGRGHLTINRHYGDQTVTGRCGGYCDTCGPDPRYGFSVDVL